MKIVVSGGTGFLGSHLVSQLRAQSHDVAVLTRHARRPGDILWSPGASDSGWTALDSADAIVNLAGEPIAAGRWTRARKAAIRQSRVSATHAIVDAIARARQRPSVLINGSAIGIYGPRGDEPVDEGTALGSDFLSATAREWEGAAMQAAPGTRVVLVRTGLALDRNGGALPRMALPFYFMAGGPLGSGRQQVAWIHQEDWTRMIVWAIETPAVSGPLNATAPTPVTNREFARTLGKVLGRPAVMPAPAFALRIALGEMADMLLTGQRVLPAKAQSLGFRFRHPLLEPALRAIYGRR
jgi:uncharacterized protein (TIGR01777 family)